jgi:PAS domain S-box-containing protein
VLDRIAEEVKAVRQGQFKPFNRAPQLHALQRLDLGFDLRMVTQELSLLRSSILDLWEEHAAHGWDAHHVIREIRWLDVSFDYVVANSVNAYSEARERTLVALDRISAAALDVGDADTFLPRLIRVLQETTAAADLVKIFIVEGQEVVLRAAAGLPGPQPDLERMRLGEGFLGRVAQTGEPRLLHSASDDRLMNDPGIRSRKIHALYAVPLVHEGRVIGLAEMGSRSAFDFSSDDKQLFRAMVHRATALIAQSELLRREREAQRVAARALAQLRTLIISAPIGVAFLDTNLRYQLVSQWLAEAHGLPAEAHKGRPLREVLPPLADRLEPALRRVLLTQEPVINLQETFALDKEPNSPRTWLFSIYPVRTDDGELLGVGKIVVDITERKEMEDNERKTAEFRDRFMSIVGHDLRNPLNAISILAETIIRREEAEGRTVRAAVRIVSASRRMEKMIGELVDFARARLGGGIPVKREPGDLRVVLQRTVEEIQAAHPEAEIKLELSGPGEGLWDSERLVQVFTNLLVNAIHHGKQESRVVMSMDGDGDGPVRVSVHNLGEPIPSELLPDLFSPFRRGAHDQPSDGKDSLGLGLYIVDQIVQGHGGRIEVESTREAGTTFRIILPRA